MALPTKAEVSTLDYVDWASPFVTVDSKTSVNSFTLDYVDWSSPFAVTRDLVAAAGTFLYIKVSGAWQQAKSLHIKNSGSWESSDDLRIKESGTWKGGTLTFN